MSGTRFAISIPQFVADGAFDPAGFRAYIARAEALGFDSAWTGEQILGSKPHLSPIQTMTYAAACTDRLRLGCMVFVTTLYSPVHLAKSLSTLDQLSRGRIEVGVGTGGRFRMFSAFGVDPNSLVARFSEGLRLMKSLWTEPRVTFEGRFWQLEGAAMEPKPFQKPCAHLVRRQPPCRAAARGEARGRLLRRRVVDYRTVRRPGSRRARCAGGSRTECGPLPDRKARLHRDGRRR